MQGDDEDDIIVDSPESPDVSGRLQNHLLASSEGSMASQLPASHEITLGSPQPSTSNKDGGLSILYIACMCSEHHESCDWDVWALEFQGENVCLGPAIGLKANLTDKKFMAIVQMHMQEEMVEEKRVRLGVVGGRGWGGDFLLQVPSQSV